MCEQSLAFIVEGVPQAQGSMKSFGRGRVVHSNPKLTAWRTKVLAKAVSEARTQKWNPRPDTPLKITAYFYLARPKHTKYGAYPAGTPDLDKLQRAIGDALSPKYGMKSIADDARIVKWDARKYWVNTGGKPGVYIEIETLEN